MIIRSTDLGTEISKDNRLILFGNRNSSFKAIQEKYPHITMKRVKQVHGDKTVETRGDSIDYQVEADAHWTNGSNLGLCISTADCCPIVLIAPNKIANIHAGWRGVENRILPKTLELWKSLGVAMKDVAVLVGPHIQFKSFEVQADVKDQLMKGFQDPNKSAYFQTKQDGKFLVDLQMIIADQLKELGLSADQTYFENIDTVTNLNYHSFRRDKANSGRQISMVAQLNL